MVKLSQHFEQKQKLSPKQILEANIVQLNYSNLEKRIIEEIENNPLLEVIEDQNSDEESVEEQNEEEFNWEELSSNSDEYDSFTKPQKKQYIENTPNLDEKNFASFYRKTLKNMVNFWTHLKRSKILRNERENSYSMSLFQ